MMGAEILGISDTRKNISIKSGFDSSLVNNEIITDINNVVSYKKEVSDFKPDLVFYLAAEPLVREAYKNPVKTINTNVMGLTNFLYSIKDLKSTKVILTVTSDKVYEHWEGCNKFVENKEFLTIMLIFTILFLVILIVIATNNYYNFHGEFRRFYCSHHTNDSRNNYGIALGF